MNYPLPRVSVLYLTFRWERKTAEESIVAWLYSLVVWTVSCFMPEAGGRTHVVLLVEPGTDGTTYMVDWNWQGLHTVVVDPDRHHYSHRVVAKQQIAIAEEQFDTILTRLAVLESMVTRFDPLHPLWLLVGRNPPNLICTEAAWWILTGERQSKPLLPRRLWKLIAKEDLWHII